LGAQLGADVLAGNYLLQQVISFAAFFLDGVAFVAEVQVGRAVGAGDAELFRRSVLRTSVVGFGFACALSVLILLVGPFGICVLTPSSAVRAVAILHLPIAALYVLVGVVPWQLDGIFIGAACGVALRNAAIVSLVVFWGAATWLAPRYGNTGLWWAMLVYIAARGTALAAHWPHLTRRLTAGSALP
jgi:MATE family multidrug resistance protein